jgi:hypothetical protein
MARQLSKKVGAVVDQELKDKVLEEMKRDDRSEGAIVRRALRAYFNMNGSANDQA